MLLNRITCYIENVCEGKSQSLGKLYCLILKNWHSHPNLEQPPPWSISSHQHWGKALHQQKDYDSLKAQMSISIFLAKRYFFHWGFSGDSSGKEPAYKCRRLERHRFNPWVRKIPWGRKWQPTPVFVPGKSQGQTNLAGYRVGIVKSWTWLKWLSTQACVF